MKRMMFTLVTCLLASPVLAADECNFSAPGGLSGDPGLYGGTSSNEGIDKLDPVFRDNVAAMMAAAAQELGGTMQIYSGYRSVERQRELWEAALVRYGSPEAARKWVAPPGNSMHNVGKAVDLRWNGQTIQYGSPISDWMAANMSRFGLTRPLSNEGWHVEPVGARGGTASGGSSGTTSGAAGETGEECQIVDMIQLPVIFLMPWETETPYRAALPGSYSSNVQ